MVCIYCGNPTKVANSRSRKRSNGVWRRRECLECQATVTSIEMVDLETAITVMNGRVLTPFSRDTLFVSIYESLKHRPSAVPDATQLTDTVIALLYPKVVDGSVRRTSIVSVAGSVLERFDEAAAVHYKAFHK